MTGQRDHITEVQLGKSVSLLVLLREVLCEVTDKSKINTKAAASLKAALAWVTALEVASLEPSAELAGRSKSLLHAPG